MPVPGIAGMAPSAVAPAGPQVYISPDSVFDNHAGVPHYAEAAFNLVSLIGAPTAYVWSVVAGTGTIQSGQGTATATIRTAGACIIRCTATIGGGGYNPEASLTYEPGEVSPGDDGGGPGGHGDFIP